MVNESKVFLFFPSLPQNHTCMNGNGEEWYAAHMTAIIEPIKVILNNSSNLEFHCTEYVYVKLILRKKVDGQSNLHYLCWWPRSGKQSYIWMQVAGVFAFLLLSILHYDSVSNQQRHNPNNYGQWIQQLDFGDLNGLHGGRRAKSWPYGAMNPASSFPKLLICY